ncbi:hypothetical protein Ngar_c17040 [Candidatus Nitrososphaera gargensis Ga9.2]|uniref:SpoVT-AbrB domain-containing protein n=1 Tax=Nitrososphaera gargensis (strain Ga9.2) TaxID=1237085 RepID=K0IK21_NITGG|nr:hypothetical protein [Candidatus Nitrososphaera gargensis]AFU58637.1 hypothetical protein Ngar_c17040 [Candidatus Nitrososphaera gargensis Ga9.2]
MSIDGLWFKSETVIFQATKGSPSLRSTVPQDVVDFLQLQPGDVLEWLANIKDNKVTVIVRKKKPADKLTAV